MIDYDQLPDVAGFDGHTPRSTCPGLGSFPIPRLTLPDSIKEVVKQAEEDLLKILEVKIPDMPSQLSGIDYNNGRTFQTYCYYNHYGYPIFIKTQ